MSKRSKIMLFLLAASLTAALTPPARAVPTCPDPATRPLCGNRIIPPALQSGTFLQFGSEYVPVLDALEALAPEILDIDKIGDLIGQPTLQSAGGNDIYVIRVTDESVTTPKRQVAISLSVHGTEPAGREGGLRYVEDLATWWTSDRHRLLYSGSVGIPLSKVLAETEIYVAILNPDGWSTGDFGGTGYRRGNATGLDLNRDYPTIGWTKQDQLIHPETRGWHALVSKLPRLTTATDIHGELTSRNNAFSDIMYPAGQWDPTRQAQELQFAQHMNDTVARKFEDEGVILQKIFNLGGDSRPMKPANFATAYDVVGYDDSGFMGDWFASEGAVELDVENFLSHMVPGNVWLGSLEQAHVAAVKGNMESTIVESLITDEVKPELALGRVAYVQDPVRLTRGAGAAGAGYSVSRMDYFADLADDAGLPVTAIPSGGLASTDLSSFDSLVLADTTVPADPDGRPVDRAAYVAALDRFVRDGGRLVLTDRAANLLVDLGLFSQSDIVKSLHQAGHVDFGSLDHPWEKGLAGVARQTYYAVPLGYRSGSSTREAPHWGVKAAAWSAKGGVTVGTIDSAGTVNLGELKHGAGSIALFGAILPTQTQGNRHVYGLADYAMSVAGGEVLHSILEYRRP